MSEAIEAAKQGDIVSMSPISAAGIGQVYTVLRVFESAYGNGTMAEIACGRRHPGDVVSIHDKKTVRVRRLCVQRKAGGK